MLTWVALPQSPSVGLRVCAEQGENGRGEGSPLSIAMTEGRPSRRGPADPARCPRPGARRSGHHLRPRTPGLPQKKKQAGQRAKKTRGPAASSSNPAPARPAPRPPGLPSVSQSAGRGLPIEPRDRTLPPGNLRSHAPVQPACEVLVWRVFLLAMRLLRVAMGRGGPGSGSLCRARRGGLPASGPGHAALPARHSLGPGEPRSAPPAPVRRHRHRFPPPLSNVTSRFCPHPPGSNRRELSLLMLSIGAARSEAN